ncbi:MAG: aspartate/glutamate racemase family protein [Phascolarctobacterium sp.]|nr:aspartate/glutamate racemase family protein [Phascolarctobacterium sp.]
MKIYIINPDYGMSRELMNKELSILSRYVNIDVELAMDCLSETVVEINSLADAIKAGPEVSRMALRAEQKGFDAIILYCFSDPGYELCKKTLQVPVYGCAKASLEYASKNYQGNIGVVLTDISREEEKRSFISKLGLDEKRFLFAAVDIANISCWDNRKLVQERLTKTCQSLAAKNVSCIILGCTSFLGLSEELTLVCDTRVLDPAVCGLKAATKE